MANPPDRAKPRFVFLGTRRRALDPPPFSDLLSSFPTEGIPITEMRRPAARRPVAPAPSVPPASVAPVPPADGSRVVVSTDLQTTLAQAERTIRQSIDYAGSLQADLEQLDNLSGRLVTDYRRIAAACHDADAKSVAAAEAIGAIEERLGLLDEIGQSAEEGRAALNALASEVAHAATAFEWQWRVMEAGVREAAQLVERVSELEKRATRLGDGDQPFPIAETIADRLEQRAADASVRIAQSADSIHTQATSIEGLRGDLARIANAIGTVEERLALLIEARHPAARDLVQALEERTADAALRLEQDAQALDAHRLRVEEAAEGTTRVAGAIDGAEQRLEALVTVTEPHARELVEALNQQAAAASARAGQASSEIQTQHVRIETLREDAAAVASDVSTVEHRIADLVDSRQAITRNLVASIEAEADGASARLLQTASDIRAQLDGVEAIRSNTMEAADEVIVLEQRLSDILESRQPLARDLTTSLEARLAEATARVERTTAVAASNQRTIESGLEQAGRLIEVVSGVESRLARLDESGPMLEKAEAVIERLEERLATAGEMLEEVTRRELTTRTRLLNLRAQRVRIRVSPRWPIVAGAAATIMLVAAGVPMLQRSQSPASNSEQPAPRVLTAGLTPPVATRDLPLTPVEPAAVATSGKSAAARKAPAKAQTPAPVKASAPAAKPKSNPFVGGLTIGSVPAGADVFVNQRFVGQTPISLEDLRAGSQVIWVEHDGYRRWTASVQVAAKKREQVNARLELIAAQ